MTMSTLLTPRLLSAISMLLACTAIGADLPKAVMKPAESTVQRQKERQKERSAAAERGYRVLVDKALLTSDFSQEVFDRLWECWPEELRSQAKRGTEKKRREMAFQRYGLTARPNDPRKPLQYVVDKDGNWTMNCFSCHGGTVYGQSYAGAPNNRFALQTLTEEVRKTKFKMGKPLSRMDVGSLVIPLGTTNGTTNAVVFGMGLMSQRDEKLNLVAAAPRQLIHHDMDAPAWWNFHKKPNIYIDGFAEKGHRGLMQFMMIPENGRDFFIKHEDDFRDVYAYLSSLRPPEFPGEIDTELAERGRGIFQQNCAECHGTYGHTPTYPNRRIPINDVGTDPVRLTALGVEGRRKYSRSWFAHGDDSEPQTTIIDPDGYVAPPLDGIWASAPYLHNGSIPTLWHLLNPTQRPTVWRPVSQQLDSELIGLTIRIEEKTPLMELDAATRRSYFDTRRFGKSNAGHDYPEELTKNQKKAVLEFLKTL